MSRPAGRHRALYPIPAPSDAAQDADGVADSAVLAEMYRRGVDDRAHLLEALDEVREERDGLASRLRSHQDTDLALQVRALRTALLVAKSRLARLEANADPGSRRLMEETGS